MPEYVWELPPLVAPTVESPTEVEGMARNHAEEAVERLALQFRKPRMEALVRAYCKQMQPLEQAFVDIITKRTIEDATGALLKMLAKLVGQRLIDGLDDDDTLRSFVRARIRTNKSSGLGDQILRIARLVLTDYANRDEVAAAGTLSLSIANLGTAAYTLRVNGIDLTWELATILARDFLEVATGTGIRAVLEFDVQEDDVFDVHDSAFTLDDGADVGSVTDGEGLADGERAFAEWVGDPLFDPSVKFVAEDLAGGPDGNGRQIIFGVGIGGPAARIDETDPRHIYVIVHQPPFEPIPATWAQVYTAINTSTVIRVKTEIAAGDVNLNGHSNDAQTTATFGGVEEGGGYLAAAIE